MSALAETFDLLDDAEVHRRGMLAESDSLLERVEELRLADRRMCPPDLAADVRSLLLRLGRVPTDRPRTARAAHHLVFLAQSRLMAANPRHLCPRPLPDRPAGAPRLTVLGQGGSWKFLALPPPPPAVEADVVAEWWQRVHLTVGRALDRWLCARDQAILAARSRRHAPNPVRAHDEAVRALRRSRAAWRNYWELRCETERMLGIARAREAVPAAGRAARARAPPRRRRGGRGGVAGIQSSRCSRS
jgi:hypothetical protein